MRTAPGCNTCFTSGTWSENGSHRILLHAPFHRLPCHGVTVLPRGKVRTRRRGWGAFSPHDAATATALAVLVAVSYLPALQGGFVWDDVTFAEEPVIHTPGGLRRIWMAPAKITRATTGPGLLQLPA